MTVKTQTSSRPRDLRHSRETLRILIAACALGTPEAIAEFLCRPIFLHAGQWRRFDQYLDVVVHMPWAWDACGRRILARDHGINEMISRFSMVPAADGRGIDCRNVYAALCQILSCIAEDPDTLADDAQVAITIRQFVRLHIVRCLREGRRSTDNENVRVAIPLGTRRLWAWFPRTVEPRRRREWLAEQDFPHDLTSYEVQDRIDRHFGTAQIFSLDASLNECDRRWLSNCLPEYAAVLFVEDLGIIEATAREKSKRPDQFPGELANLSSQQRYNLTKAGLEQVANGKLCFRQIPHLSLQVASAASRYLGMGWRKEEGRRPSSLYRNLARIIAGNGKFREAVAAMGLLERVEQIGAMDTLPDAQNVPDWLQVLVRQLAMPGQVNWPQLVEGLAGVLLARPVSWETMTCAAFLRVALVFGQDIAAMTGVPLNADAAWDLAVTLDPVNLAPIPNLASGSPLRPLFEALRLMEGDCVDQGKSPVSLRILCDGEMQSQVRLAEPPQVCRIPLHPGNWTIYTNIGRELWSACLSESQLRLLGDDSRGDRLSLAASPAVPDDQDLTDGAGTGCGRLRVEVVRGLRGGWLRIELVLRDGGHHV